MLVGASDRTDVLLWLASAEYVCRRCRKEKEIALRKEAMMRIHVEVRPRQRGGPSRACRGCRDTRNPRHRGNRW